MSTVAITIEIDESQLSRYSDEFLATAWYVAQANPAPFGDHQAGELVERIGREIIRRWLRGVSPELWNHQGRHHYWDHLRRLASYQPGSADPADPQWHHGTWVAKEPEAEPSTDAGEVSR